MGQGRSTTGSKTIYKQSKDGLDLNGIYKLSINNPGALTVTITDVYFGTIQVEPKTTIPIDAHPDYPFDVSITITFNELAPNTDKIIVIYTRVYGTSENDNNQHIIK